MGNCNSIINKIYFKKLKKNPLGARVMWETGYSHNLKVSPHRLFTDYKRVNAFVMERSGDHFLNVIKFSITNIGTTCCLGMVKYLT